MFKFGGNMKFINIDSNYIKKLNLACPEVYYKSVGYDNKPKSIKTGKTLIRNVIDSR